MVRPRNKDGRRKTPSNGTIILWSCGENKKQRKTEEEMDRKCDGRSKDKGHKSTRSSR